MLTAAFLILAIPAWIFVIMGVLGALLNLSIYYDGRWWAQPLWVATGFPVALLGLFGLVWIVLILISVIVNA